MKKILQIMPAPDGLRAYLRNEETKTATTTPVVGIALVEETDDLGTDTCTEYMVHFHDCIVLASDVDNLMFIEHPDEDSTEHPYTERVI